MHHELHVMTSLTLCSHSVPFITLSQGGEENIRIFYLLRWYKIPYLDIMRLFSTSFLLYKHFISFIHYWFCPHFSVNLIWPRLCRLERIVISLWNHQCEKRIYLCNHYVITGNIKDIDITSISGIGHRRPRMCRCSFQQNKTVLWSNWSVPPLWLRVCLSVKTGAKSYCRLSESKPADSQTYMAHWSLFYFKC